VSIPANAQLLLHNGFRAWAARRHGLVGEFTWLGPDRNLLDRRAFRNGMTNAGTALWSNGLSASCTGSGFTLEGDPVLNRSNPPGCRTRARETVGRDQTVSTPGISLICAIPRL